jgi:aldose 1-epimerase
MTLLRITNRHGVSVLLSTFGARVVELMAPDRDGVLGNIVLGYDTEEQYRDDPGSYFGATVGRVAGRLAGARFVGSGLDFPLHANEGSTHLHGGPSRALDRVDWSLQTSPNEASAVFHYLSPAGEEGYPGALEITCSYYLTDDNDLELEITATSDAATPVNIVNHTYFNLSGDARDSIVDHELTIPGSSILATDQLLLPTGGVVAVAGTPYDFLAARRIRDNLPVGCSEPWPGVDSTYLLDRGHSAAATLCHQTSGRRIEIRTTEPTLQVYTGNRIEAGVGRAGAPHGPGRGICLEAHRVPDSPALPDWPSIVIVPGELYAQRTVWSLSTY